MNRFLYLFWACFCLLAFYFLPGYSWGEEKKGIKESGREVKESGKALLDKTGSAFQKTGKAFKEAGRELKENVGETWKDLKRDLKK
jgi:hypothetical protein